MMYEELKKAYEESLQKCSELEKEIENKDLRIEHLTELPNDEQICSVCGEPLTEYTEQ